MDYKTYRLPLTKGVKIRIFVVASTGAASWCGTGYIRDRFVMERKRVSLERESWRGAQTLLTMFFLCFRVEQVLQFFGVRGKLFAGTVFLLSSYSTSVIFHPFVCATGVEAFGGVCRLG